MDLISPSNSFRSASNVSFLDHDNRSWSFSTDLGLLKITFFTADIVRIALRPQHALRYHRSFCLPDRRPLASLPTWSSQDATNIEMRTAHLVVSVLQGTSLNIDVARINQHRTYEPLLNCSIGINLQGFLSSSFSLNEDDRIFGGGQRTGHLNQRGKQLSLWTTDPVPDHNDKTDAMYQSVPFFSMLSGSSMSGIFFDSSWQSAIDLGYTDPARIMYTTQDPEIVMYLFGGRTPDDVLEQYTWITGRPIALPRWSLGNQQSRWSYLSANEVRSVASQFREQEIPCDAIYLDIDYMDGYRDFTWNNQTFPHPAEFIRDLREQGFRIIPIIDPGVKVDADYAVYRAGLERGYFVRTHAGQPFEGWVWPGLSAWADFAREDVRTWWGDLHADFAAMGIEGIWDDMNEPSQAGMSAPPEIEIPFGATLPLDAQHGLPDTPIAHAEFHNAFGFEMTHATYDGLRRLNPDVRPFVLTRAATAGSQRYAVVWNGDNSSIWEHLRLAITMNIGLSLSGLPLTGFDIGGFWHDTTPELLVRFTQLGACMPFCRNHSSMGTDRQEPWAFGEPYTHIIRSAIELRYRLLPLLVTLAHETAITGMPMVRPIWWNDRNNTLLDCEDEFLLGNDLIIAPVVDKAASERQIIFPSGEWFVFGTNDVVPSPDYTKPNTYTVSVDLSTTPLFARAGSIIPMAPVVQHTAEPYTEPLELHVYLTATTKIAKGTVWDDDDHPDAINRGSFASYAYTATWEGDKVVCHIRHTNGEFTSRYPAGRIVWHVPMPWQIPDNDHVFDIHAPELTVSATVFAR